MAEIEQSSGQPAGSSPVEQNVDTAPTQSTSPIINENEANAKSDSLWDAVKRVVTFGASETKRITDVREKLNPFSTEPPGSEKPTNK